MAKRGGRYPGIDVQEFYELAHELFTPEEATDLKIVLEAGALPAPLEIVEERTVGPSLGVDSIRSGVRAALIGGIAVAIFMVLYYSLSGLLAVLALILNLVIIIVKIIYTRNIMTLVYYLF